MARQPLTPARPSLRGWLAERYRLTPWWLRVLIIFVASRIVTTTFLLAFAAMQADNPWTGAQPNYFDYAKIWDGHWYYIIALVGYPTELPMTADGFVGESAWAFMPAYPALCRLLTIITGLDFRIVAVIVSVACALGAALIFYRLLIRFLPEGTALFSVLLFLVAPLSPILQVSYAESMHALLLVLALYLLATRQYVLLLPVIAVMALTRPSGLAFALALALHFGYRMLPSQRADFPLIERLTAALAAVVSGVAGLAWLLIAWAVTGSLTAYTDTELAWRRSYIGDTELLPFTPWIDGARFWLQFPAGPLIVAVTAIAMVGFVVLLVSPAGRRISVDLRFWLVSYALYLLAVFFPQSSTFRLLVPLFPALAIVAQPRSRIYRVALVLLCLVGQWVWIWIAWFVDGRDWTPP